MPPPPIVRFNNVRLVQSDGILFDDVTFSIHAHQRLCLIGRNGSGKSTLLKIIAGQIDIDNGERLFQPGLKIGLLPQEPTMGGFSTVAEYGASGGAQPYRFRSFADALDINLSQSPEGLSGGEVKRAALAKTLAEEPDLLLLDEPTNHLDIASIEWLESELKNFSGATLTISHDRAFLNNSTKQILWLNHGKIREYGRGFTHFSEWSDDIVEQEAEKLDKLDKLISEETVWSQQGISARRKRNQGRLRRLYELRHQRAAVREQENIGKISLASGALSGKIAIEAFGVAKRYGNHDVLKPFDIKILRGDKIGIVGPNGAGKSTLLHLLLGQIFPDEGYIKQGTNLTPTFIDQKRDTLKAGLTAWEYLADSGGDSIIVGDKPRHVVTYMQEFLFSKSQARCPVEALSGGERNRLTLAKAIANPSNFLILDEPTNDLDMETLDLLQEMLSEYDGTLLLVSHDRDFIDRVVTSTLILDGKGGIFDYPGGYSDALTQHNNSKAQQTTALKGQDKKNQRQKNIEKPKKLSSSDNKKGKKLTYAQEIRLKQLPDLIEAGEAQMAKLEAKLAEPDLYQRDPDSFTMASEKVGELRKKLDALEVEWLELEERANP